MGSNAYQRLVLEHGKKQTKAIRLLKYLFGLSVWWMIGQTFLLPTPQDYFPTPENLDGGGHRMKTNTTLEAGNEAIYCAQTVLNLVMVT